MFFSQLDWHFPSLCIWPEGQDLFAICRSTADACETFNSAAFALIIGRLLGWRVNGLEMSLYLTLISWELRGTCPGCRLTAFWHLFAREWDCDLDWEWEWEWDRVHWIKNLIAAINSCKFCAAQLSKVPTICVKNGVIGVIRQRFAVSFSLLISVSFGASVWLSYYAILPFVMLIVRLCVPFALAVVVALNLTHKPGHG